MTHMKDIRTVVEFYHQIAYNHKQQDVAQSVEPIRPMSNISRRTGYTAKRTHKQPSRNGAPIQANRAAK